MNTLRIALFCLAFAACRDDESRPTGPTTPIPEQGVVASVTVDNLNAAVGQTVRVHSRDGGFLGGLDHGRKG